MVSVAQNSTREELKFTDWLSSLNSYLGKNWLLAMEPQQLLHLETILKLRMLTEIDHSCIDLKMKAMDVHL